jgi:uncharacterized protein (TIGR03118 family)
MKKLFPLMAILGIGCDNEALENTTPSAASGLVARTDIVTDATDPMLVNAWGLSFNPAGVAWVSAAETGVSAVYDANGGHVLPSVTIPAPGGATAAPTGQAFNTNPGAFMGDHFIFVTEDGVIAGWQSGAAAVMRVDNSGSEAIYKGVALGNAGSGQSRLYATNFHAGTVDTYDGAYHPVAAAFHDPQLPAGFAPFNITVIQGAVLVSYAMQDDAKEDDVKGAGLGYVDIFDGDGGFQGRLISAGELNAPWGMTLAPGGFGAAPNRLLVGNFGDGLIHYYDFDMTSRTAVLAGTLRDAAGNNLAIDGLWAIEFGPGTGGFAADTLYFTAGPNDEKAGAFGRLQTTAMGNAGGTTGTTPPSGGTTTGGTTGGTTTGGTTGGYMP